MGNKTMRKNNRNQNVNWPSHGNPFTIPELKDLNKDFKEISLRVKLDKEIKAGKLVAKIGIKRVKMGRPKNVHVMLPLTTAALDLAVKDGVEIDNKLIHTLTGKTQPIPNKQFKSVFSSI